MQLQALWEPLVLEGVEGVQEAEVHQVQGRSKQLDWHQGDHLALYQEDWFNHDRYDGVRYHDGDGEVDQRTALRWPERQVSNILKPDGVDYLWEEEEGEHPQGREGEGKDRLSERP